MNDRITAGAASVLGALIAATGITRWYFKPARLPGRHTAAGLLLRPQEALDQFEARCPAEDRPTLHLRLHLGGEICTECRNPNLSKGPA